MSALPSVTANRYPELLVHGSKIEYDKFKDADASYQHSEGYKIVIEPMSSVYIHECPPNPQRKAGLALHG